MYVIFAADLPLTYPWGSVHYLLSVWWLNIFGVCPCRFHATIDVLFQVCEINWCPIFNLQSSIFEFHTKTDNSGDPPFPGNKYVQSIDTCQFLYFLNICNWHLAFFHINCKDEFIPITCSKSLFFYNLMKVRHACVKLLIIIDPNRNDLALTKESASVLWWSYHCLLYHKLV